MISHYYCLDSLNGNSHPGDLASELMFLKYFNRQMSTRNEWAELSHLLVIFSMCLLSSHVKNSKAYDPVDDA